MSARHGEQDWSVPIIVTEGYEYFLSNYDTRPFTAKEVGDAYIVGRAALYEKISRRRLAEDEGKGDKLRALYFPGATPCQNFLFQSTLYFDEIFYLSPGSTLFDPSNGKPNAQDDAKRGYFSSAILDEDKAKHSFFDRLSAFDEDVLPLKQAGVLRPLTPTMQDHPDFLTLLTADFDDEEFKSIARQYAPDPIFLAPSKFHRHFLKFTEIRNDAESFRKCLKDKIQESRDPFGPASGGFDRMINVSGQLGASILLNHAYLLADQFDLIPITDDLGAHRLMARKLERIAESEEFADYRRQLDLKTSTLAIRVLEMYLPRFKFVTFEDALESRERLRGPLENFRSQMCAFAAQIDATPYSKDLLLEIEKTVATKVSPAVEALETDLQKTRDTFLAKTVRNAQTGTIPIVASMFAGLPTEAVISLSAGVLTIEAAIETWREVKIHRRNGLSILTR